MKECDFTSSKFDGDIFPFFLRYTSITTALHTSIQVYMKISESNLFIMVEIMSLYIFTVLLKLHVNQMVPKDTLLVSS